MYKQEEKRRREYLLNIILVTFLASLGVFGIIISFNHFRYQDHYRGLEPSVFLPIFILFCALFYIFKKGFVLTTSYLLIILYAIFSILAALKWGFDLPNVIISYLMIIVMASILIGSRFATVVTVILGFLVIVIGYYQIRISMPSTYWRLEKPEIVDTIGYVVELIFVMTVAGLSKSEKDKSLRRALKSEGLLQKELERINRLYHFAEFGKISSGAFHDLMSPLTSMAINIQELDESNEKTKEAKHHLNLAVKSAAKLQGLMQNIDKQIKLESEDTSFYLHHEIKQAVELLSYKARKNSCTIITECDKKISLVGNKVKFYQIMTNLISNAIDAYENHEGPNTKERKVHITLDKTEEEAEIKITDWGAGIPEDKIPHIFDAFFTTKKFEKGTGLGLSIAKENIEKKFGGTISIESKAGKGTTFKVRIPLITQTNCDLYG